MEPGLKMTRRERLVRLAGGGLLTAAGFVLFAVSKHYDAANRAAFAAILAILFGASWFGQGLRGRRDGPGPTDDDGDAPIGPGVSPERTMAGVLLAWLVPGLGHWLIGRRKKAALFFVTITALFAGGIALAHGRNLNYDRDGVYFLAYAFNALETAIAWLLTRDLERTSEIPLLQLGFLYTAVGSLLNVVVITDFLSTCTRSAGAPAPHVDRVDRVDHAEKEDVTGDLA